MRWIWTIVLLAASAAQADPAAAPSPPRPHIFGISHIALWVHDIAATRAFYKAFLGFEEPYYINNPDGTLHLTWMKINDHQTIEIFPEKEAGSDRLYHVALETDDAVAMRDYLAAHGVKVPDKVGAGKIGNLNYFIHDPDGHIVEIVQYKESGWTMLSKGKFLPETRIAAHLPHIGILVGDVEASKKFYEDILGFKEIWRGSKNGKTLTGFTSASRTAGISWNSCSIPICPMRTSAAPIIISAWKFPTSTRPPTSCGSGRR